MLLLCTVRHLPLFRLAISNHSVVEVLVVVEGGVEGGVEGVELLVPLPVEPVPAEVLPPLLAVDPEELADEPACPDTTACSIAFSVSMFAPGSVPSDAAPL